MTRVLKDVPAAWRDFCCAAARALLDLFFPPPAGCPLCGGRAEEEGGPCPACRERLAAYRKQVGCAVCGAFYVEGAPPAGEPGICAACRREPPPFTRACSLGPYEGSLKEAVLRLKFGGERWLARPLGELLAELARTFPAERPVLVPVPLSGGRLRERGYNQAALLAREMSLALGWPAVEALVKIKEAPPQERLTARERLAAPAGAFAPAKNLSPESEVVLVDDVITTGATASECARALLGAGVRAVFVVAAAGPRRA